MKRFGFSLDSHQIEWVLSPIRDRLDVIELLMKSIKVMLVNDQPPAEQASGSLILSVSKMSRIFFLAKTKIFSINFPYSTQFDEDSNSFSFTTRSRANIDNRRTSIILEWINGSDRRQSKELFDAPYEFIDIAPDDEELPDLLLELLLMDDGYIRFDHDIERSNGHMHPLNHLDVFFSSSATFKIGLHKKIQCEDLIDILNLHSNCHYLEAIN